MGSTKAITDGSFDSDVSKAKVPVLVDFWAEWCGPCKALSPKLEEIAGELTGKVEVVKMNVDENPSTPSKFSVRGIPTLILFKNGQAVDQLVGNQPKDAIVQFLSKYI